MERTTPVGGAKRVRAAGSLGLAAALAVGAMTGPARGADEKEKPAVPAQTAEQQAKAQEEDRRAAGILDEAKRAYEQKNRGQAVAKYREFLQHFPKRPEAMAAQYGLGVALAETADRDWNAVIAALSPVVTAEGVPDKGRAYYWLGVALRVTGEQQLAGVTKPAEQKEQLDKAMKRIASAAVQLATADRVLTASVEPKPAGNAKELPAALEMAAGAKVAGAEALIRTGKHGEAAELVRPFASDPVWAKSAQRAAGLTALGEALVAAGDYPGAFAALAEVAPFAEQVGVGLRAKYWIGRILQETGERPEAVVQYEWVGVMYPMHKKKAEEALRNKEAWRERPIEQMRLEALVRGVPEYVAQAAYQGATIQFEYGQFAEAAAKYQAFLQTAPNSELAPMAKLRQGISFAQAKQLPEAMRVLRPLAETPALGDQATWWVGKVQRAAADPTNRAAQMQQTQAAIATFGRAAEKAAALGKTDPAAASRRLDILMDVGDAYAAIKQFKEAAPVYETVAKDTGNAERAEIAHERWAMALSKVGQADASDAACKAFLEKYPASMLRPSVMFWQAENSYRRGVELAKSSDAGTPAVAEQVKKLQEQAAARYAAVVEKWPEFPHASAARFGVGMAHYRQGAYEKAGKQLANVLESDRVGELAAASYYQADCLIRSMPESAEDALSAARLAGQLEEAVKLLSGFVTGEERAEMPDAMLKLADCYQRQATILADAAEKAKAFQGARETYDKLISKYPKHPALASAVMERARCVAAMGDAGGAINQLNRFRNDAQLSKSDVAPLAIARLAELMTKNGRATDAAAMLEKARAEYEPQLAGDARRSAWIPALRYQHAAALKEAGKRPEAMALFEAIAKEFADRPEAAEASLALIGVRKDEALARLAAARQGMAAVPVDQAVDPKLVEAQTEATKGVSEIAAALAEHAERLGEKAEGSDLHVRTLRDAAGAWRAVAEVEVDAARRAKGEEALKRLKERAGNGPAAGKSNSAPRPPEVALAAIPVTPGEQKARELANKAIDVAPESPVCGDLRLELAKMYFDRGEADAAIQMLSAALDKQAAGEEGQKLRVGLGNAYLMKKDAEGAMRQALAALENSNSPSRPAAYLVKGRAQLLAKDYGGAITTLSRYRNGAEKYVQAGPVTEEGLLRLGEAYAAAGNWGESAATYEHLLGRFPQGKWATEARFGKAVALQKAKQFDRAIEAYQEVTRRTGSEMAARAQMQIGLCRAEQKRWQEAVDALLAVHGTYDYADVSASASLEAGKALVQMKEPARAKDVLERVVREHPGTEWATLAQKRLAEIQ